MHGNRGDPTEIYDLIKVVLSCKTLLAQANISEGSGGPKKELLGRVQTLFSVTHL